MVGCTLYKTHRLATLLDVKVFIPVHYFIVVVVVV